jgi:hypothetical protein
MKDTAKAAAARVFAGFFSLMAVSMSGFVTPNDRSNGRTASPHASEHSKLTLAPSNGGSTGWMPCKREQKTVMNTTPSSRRAKP